jgi:hypothetical protein
VSDDNEEAATKLLHLALVLAQQRWTRPIWKSKDALNQFAGPLGGGLNDDDHGGERK